MSKLLAFLPRRKPTLRAIGYSTVLRLARDGDGLTPHEIGTLRRLAKVAGLPYTAEVEAATLAATAPKRADYLDETARVVERRWMTVAHVFALIGWIVGLVTLCGMAWLWGPAFLSLLAAFFGFAWRFIASGLGAAATGGAFIAIALGASAYQRRKVHRIGMRSAVLRAAGAEAEAIVDAFRQADAA